LRIKELQSGSIRASAPTGARCTSAMVSPISARTRSLSASGSDGHACPPRMPGSRVMTMGYAVPGTVLAVGVLLPLGAIDRWFDFTQ